MRVHAPHWVAVADQNVQHKAQNITYLYTWHEFCDVQKQVYRLVFTDLQDQVQVEE